MILSSDIKIQKIVNPILAKKSASPVISYKGDTFVKGENSIDEKLADYYKEIEDIKKQVSKYLEISIKAARQFEILHTKQHISLNDKRVINVRLKCREADQKVEELNSRLDNLHEYVKKLEIFNIKQKENPHTSFFYNPDLSNTEKLSIANSSDGILTVDEFASKLGLDTEVVEKWINEDTIQSDTLNLSLKNKIVYIDTYFGKNSTFLKNLQEELPTSISSIAFDFKYNFPEGKLIKCIKEGQIVPLGLDKDTKFSENILINIENPINKKTIEEHTKYTPVPSEKYYKGTKLRDNIPIPVSKLSELGFGSKEELIDLAKKGKLKTIKVESETNNKKSFIAIDINDNETQRQLLLNRSKNNSTLSLQEFASKYKLKMQEVKELIDKDEFGIIPEYIFDVDYKTTFVNLNTEKNKTFIERLLFERELQRQFISDSRKDSLINKLESLKMKLVWYYCPYTKAIAARNASETPWVIPIFEKVDMDGKKSITDKEEKILKSYYKNMWKDSGIEEFRAGMKQAKETIEQYKMFGIGSIEDENVRRIIEETMS